MRFLFIISFFLLTACGTTIPEEKVVVVPETQRTESLETLPSTLSIPHFASMTLSGTGLKLDTVLEKNAQYTKYGISYRSNGLKITGVLLIPEGEGSHPLVIFNHGYIDPAIYTQGRGLKREQAYFAKKGFAVLHTDYRGHAGSDPSPMTEKEYDGNLEYAMDSANAILAMREAKLKGVNTDKVGMLGHSMGGGVTLAILTARPDLVDAAVLYAPVHADVWENFNRWRRMREEGDGTLELRGDKEANPEFWKNLSPITFISSIQAPVLIAHGTKDKDVPVEWSDTIYSKLLAEDKEVSFERYDDEGHEFSFAWEDFMRKSTGFFAANLSAGKEVK